jgi:hypothetical protein
VRESNLSVSHQKSAPFNGTTDLETAVESKLDKLSQFKTDFSMTRTKMLKTGVHRLFRFFRFDVSRWPALGQRTQIGFPDKTNYLSISGLDISQDELDSLNNFRTDRYYWLNEYRWRLLLQIGIPFKGMTIFEPGAGIGDQTTWLLQQGASKITTGDGRKVNVGILEKRFSTNSKVVVIQGDLENCLDLPEFQIKTDLVYCWGVYYHINDPMPEFPILKKLSLIAPMIIMDFQVSLTGLDYIKTYPRDDTSASISHESGRQTMTSMAKAVRDIFGFAYFPAEQMSWNDPACINDPRRIIVGSKTPLTLSGLIEAGK